MRWIVIRINKHIARRLTELVRIGARSEVASVQGAGREGTYGPYRVHSTVSYFTGRLRRARVVVVRLYTQERSQNAQAKVVVLCFKYTAQRFYAVQLLTFIY